MFKYTVIDNRNEERHVTAARVAEDPSGRVKFYDEADEIVGSFVGTSAYWKDSPTEG